MKISLAPGRMDKFEVRARLLEYKTTMEAIQNLASRRTGRIAPKDWPTARQQMRDLQKALGEDYRPRSTVRGEKAMTELEHRLFYRVIAGAKSHINVDWGSKPDETWFDELSEALADINDGLRYAHKPEGENREMRRPA
jgi:hypothetical protein